MSEAATYETWCVRYSDYYDTEPERRIGYDDYLRNHAVIAAVLD